jgi:hypothetical protein
MSQAGIISFESDPEIPIEFITDSGTAIAVGNVINLLGGIGTSTSASGSTIKFDSSTSGFSWVVVTSADNPITLESDHGYICKGAVAVQFQLPAAATVGMTFRILGYNALWSISQNANQQIILGIATSTAGVSGGIQANTVSDSIECTCVTANLEWASGFGKQGNPTVF